MKEHWNYVRIELKIFCSDNMWPNSTNLFMPPGYVIFCFSKFSRTSLRVRGFPCGFENSSKFGIFFEIWNFLRKFEESSNYLEFSTKIWRFYQIFGRFFFLPKFLPNFKKSSEYFVDFFFFQKFFQIFEDFFSFQIITQYFEEFFLGIK